MNDLKFALRQLLKNPGFTITAVLTLALGIGANTSLFTAVNTILLRPLHVTAPSRLVYLANKNAETLTFPFFERLRGAATSFSGFAAAQYGATQRQLIASGEGATEVESVRAQAVTGSFFSVLDVPQLLGRPLNVEDDRPGAGQPVAVISHAFWQRRFAGEADVLGKVVQLDDVPVTIVGVMPAGFVGFEIGPNPEVWFPVQLVTQFGARDRNRLAEGVDWLVLFGRLGRGVTREQAQTEVDVLFRQQLQEQLGKDPNLTAADRERLLNQRLELRPGSSGYFGARSGFKQPLIVLMAAVAVVLMIACANVAGLMIARGATRQREFAIRAALGAGRRGILRQLATESALLAALAGALGLIFAQWGTEFLGAYLAESSESPVPLVPDSRVLLFTISVSLLSAALFGLVPALRASRIDLATTIKCQGGYASSAGRTRVQPSLVVAQVTLSVLLLAGAGLFIRTLHNLQTIDLGFRRDNLLAFSLDPGPWRPSNPARFMQRVLNELETLPGVGSASVGGAGMLSGNGYHTTFAVDGYTPAPGEEMRAAAILAGPRFFETIGAPLLRGREFSLADEPVASAAQGGTTSVVILGETIARRFFGDADPVGKYITITQWALKGVRLEVIGVAMDTKYSPNLRQPTPLEFYLPFFGGGIQMPPKFYVRADHSAAAIAADIHQAVRHIAPQLTVRNLETMDGMIDGLLVRERIIAQLTGFFGAFALLLASLGIYGLLSYNVAQRTREIGVHVALGATMRDMVELVLRRGLTLVLIGCVLGIGAALMVTRFVGALLYGVQPADPSTFAAVALLLGLVAFFACLIPARRATRVDPMEALRHE